MTVPPAVPAPTAAANPALPPTPTPVCGMQRNLGTIGLAQVKVENGFDPELAVERVMGLMEEIGHFDGSANPDGTCSTSSQRTWQQLREFFNLSSSAVISTAPPDATSLSSKAPAQVAKWLWTGLIETLQARSRTDHFKKTLRTLQRIRRAQTDQRLDG